ncbi:MAG: hypothetical protein DRJ44_07700 [Thermoprotei archaeon]|nr:MAG: hypothetical protein DRJ44_07700 [Thermoprotei archaeon]
MKVLMYIDDLSIKGGGERIAMYFLKALLNNKMDTYILTLTNVNTFEEINEYYRENPEKFFKAWSIARWLYIIPKKIKLISIVLDFIFFIAIYLQLLLVNRKIKPDIYVVIVNTTCQNAPFLLHGRPVISWGLTPFKTKWPLIPHNVVLRKGLITKRLTLIVGSKRQKQVSDAEYKPYIRVITVGYDDKLFEYINGEKIEGRIVYVARISPEKRVNLAIEAARLLKDKYSKDFELVVVGYPQNIRYYKELKKMIVRYGLIENVKMVPRGSPEVIKQNLVRAEIFWNFSEGYGGVINYEAMACGCIPVLSNNFKDQVGSYGFTVNSIEKAAEVTAKILKMDKNSKRNHHLEYSKYVKTFSRTSFEKKFINLLHQVTERS